MRYPHETFEIVDGRADHVDTTVGVVGPVDRHLVDPESGAFGDDEQLGVEEPPVVFHERENTLGNFAAHGLEAALGVAEFDTHRRAHQGVVTA